MDSTHKPGTDFYKFATGNWIEYHPWNKEYARWTAFSMLDDEVDHQLYQLILELKNDVNNAYSLNMSKFYNKMSDYETRNSLGGSVLKRHIDRINACNSKDELIQLMSSEYIKESFLNTSIGEDEKNPGFYIINMYQNLSFGNRDYYSSVSDDENKLKVINTWKEVCKKVMLALDLEESLIDNIIETYFKYENEIAVYAYSMEQLDEFVNNYHMMSVDEASEVLDYDIRHYLSLHNFNETEEINICQIEPIKKAFQILSDISLDDLKLVCLYKFICSSFKSLSDEVRDLAFEFENKIYGTEKQPDKWKREVSTMTSVFGEIISQIYVQKYFDESSKKYIEDMIGDLKVSFKSIINNQTWLSDKTKQIAVEKLASMKYKIGYPNKWLDYSDMEIDNSLCYFDMTIELSKYFYKKEYDRCYNKQVDKELWYMNPYEVNAYYDPCSNEIAFPAGILQNPFFDKNGTDAMNYGAIGSVIGHEMTHGFDMNGRMFDLNGKMIDWWTNEDSEKFIELTKDTVNQFNQIESGVRDLKINGELTVNENIADCGGLRIAYLALLNKYNGELTKEQKQDFFISYAQTESAVYTDEIMEYQVLNNTHSPSFARVNGTLPMIDEWYDAFDIKETEKLYIEKDKRSKLW